jgi:tetratricopeptide (TPR) repeat protein
MLAKSSPPITIEGCSWSFAIARRKISCLSVSRSGGGWSISWVASVYGKVSSGGIRFSSSSARSNFLALVAREIIHLAGHEGKEATEEFQKIIAHRGVAPLAPEWALAHVQLGRAYVMSGNVAGAKTAYQDFLKLWNDADADIPILKEAKAEYANLQ